MAKRVLKITVEHGETVKVGRENCYTDEDITRARAHAKAMAPRGSTVTFETK